jgi:Toprim domain-containing protein
MQYNTSNLRLQAGSCPRCGYRLGRTSKRCFNCDYNERGSDGPWAESDQSSIWKAEIIWDQANSLDHCTEVREYLKQRHVFELATTCDQLRAAHGLHRIAKIRAYGSILVGRIWHIRKGFVGVHVTRCEWIGGDKPYWRDDGGRRTIGACQGGAVWFGAVTPDSYLVVGEGIETVLSAMILWNATAGAATLGTAGLESLVLPSAARRVVIAADNDEPIPPHKVGIGLRTAKSARRLWLAEDPNIDVEIRVAPPPMPGEHKRDWNDVLMEQTHG